MNGKIVVFFVWILALFVLQALGGYRQVCSYRKAVRRVHQRGNVGIGQKRGGLRAGYLALIACDSTGIITYAEVMEGMTCFASFRPRRELLGRPLMGTHISEFLQLFAALDKKQRKRMKGYIQAIEALDRRLYPEHWSQAETDVLTVEPMSVSR